MSTADKPGPEAILPTYAAGAEIYARQRNKSLFERAWLERALGAASSRQALDIGCGPGEPIGRWLVEGGCTLTGVDGAGPMLALFSAALPEARAELADMRQLALGRRFGLILAWDSLFHLSPADQRAMFAVFASHSEPGAALLFTSGPAAGEAWGHAAGGPVYHASLAPSDYRACLAESGFSVLRFIPEDPDCDRHSVWLARFNGG